jgi:hypothetical protein
MKRTKSDLEKQLQNGDILEQLQAEEELERRRQEELREEQELDNLLREAKRNKEINKRVPYVRPSLKTSPKKRTRKIVIQDDSPEPGGSLTKRMRLFRRAHPETRRRFMEEQSMEHIYNPNSFGKQKLRLVENDIRYLSKKS